MNIDLKIAQAAVLEPIDKIAHKAGIPEEYLEIYGKEKAPTQRRGLFLFEMFQ